MNFSKALLDILSCPYCGENLEMQKNGAFCKRDNVLYPYTESRALDLRLPKIKNITLDFQVGPKEDIQRDISFEILKKNVSPEIDFSSVKKPHNISEADLTYFPKAKNENSLALDLGCGNAHFREVIEYAGFEYVGIDSKNSRAPIMADAQALPFVKNSFEFIWTNAMIQYIPFAFPMIADVSRVLQPDGILMGTVGYLEGFDGNSYYMYTRLGILNLLEYGGFKVKVIAPDNWWTGLYAISAMGLFPRMPRIIPRTFVRPIEWLSKLWWRFASMRNQNYTESERLARTTGGFTFIAEKS